MTALRAIQLPADRDALMQLDTSFTTDRIYRVAATATSFALVEELVSPPCSKSFPLGQELSDDRMWEYGLVADDHGTITGFAALRYERWNRRAAIWHLYVTPRQRGTGLGRRRTRSSPRTCAATPPAALSARSFRCAAAG